MLGTAESRANWTLEVGDGSTDGGPAFSTLGHCGEIVFVIDERRKTADEKDRPEREEEMLKRKEGSAEGSAGR